jgi:putative transposase
MGMTKSRIAYPTDLNDTEYGQIAPLLETTRKRGRAREIAYREILNAIFYVLKTGCGWRELPHDFPKWQTAYYYFRQFRLYGLWEEINERVCQAVRKTEGRRAEPTAMIIDSQSVKSAEGGEAIGFDGGKKVHGRKRVLLTDTLGFARLVKVVAADLHDSHAGYQLLCTLQHRPFWLPCLRKIFADGGFRGNLEDWVRQSLHIQLDIVLKEEGQTGFQVLPKRWVIERTNAWITRQRRLARDYERLPASSESFIYATMIRLGLRRLSRISNY